MDITEFFPGDMAHRSCPGGTRHRRWEHGPWGWVPGVGGNEVKWILVSGGFPQGDGVPPSVTESFPTYSFLRQYAFILKIYL